MRLQGLVPVQEGGASHVIAYRWPEEGGARFARAELVVGGGEVVAGALAVLDEPPSTAGTTDVLVVLTAGATDAAARSGPRSPWSCWWIPSSSGTT